MDIWKCFEYASFALFVGGACVAGLQEQGYLGGLPKGKKEPSILDCFVGPKEPEEKHKISSTPPAP